MAVGRAAGAWPGDTLRRLAHGSSPYPSPGTSRRGGISIPSYSMINGRQEEFRRNRKSMLPHGEAIGVSYWPAVGDLIFLTTPTKRSGTMQAAFNNALTRYGFKLAGWNADHVEDIEMGGSDDFDNLWPLEAGVNSRAGNWQLGQPVTFSRDDEPVGNVHGPIAIQGQDYLRGRWLRIRDFQDPPGGNP